MTDPCQGCSISDKICLLKTNKVLCPCVKCIVKVKCVDQCKEYVHFYRSYGFDKHSRKKTGFYASVNVNTTIPSTTKIKRKNE